MKRYYSPQLDRELVSALYHEAKARHIPMTKLANELIRSGLKSPTSQWQGDKLFEARLRLQPRRRS